MPSDPSAVAREIVDVVEVALASALGVRMPGRVRNIAEGRIKAALAQARAEEIEIALEECRRYEPDDEPATPTGRGYAEACVDIRCAIERRARALSTPAPSP